MKKTITISIANTLFHVEEDAYEALTTYLASIKAHFAANSDRDEILRDIEARIAERFSESKVNIVTSEDVAQLIAIMGTVEQFTESTHTEESATEKQKTLKRLYRDPDQAVIAGVSAGLAHYFGIDPVIVRIIFLVSLLIGGTGILAYIILWIAVPEATSPTEKLSMRGEAVTLSTVSELVKEKVAKVTDKETTKKLLSFPAEFLRGVAKFLQHIVFPAIRIIAGIILIIICAVIIVSLTVVAGVLLSGAPAALVAPYGVVLSNPLIYAAIIAGYLALLIPTIIIFLLALSFIRKKKTISRQLWVSFAILWIAAVLIASIAGSRIALRTQQVVRESPTFSVATEAMAIVPFSELVVQNAKTVTLVQGEKSEVVVAGRQIDLDYLEIVSENGRLLIGSKNRPWSCFLFCNGRPVQITVTTPNISDIVVENASSIEGEFAVETLSVRLRNASRAELMITAKEMTVVAENTSQVQLSGSVGTLEAELANASRLNAETFAANAITVTAKNASRATVAPKQRLSVKTENGSTIFYSGDPVITEELRNGSTLKKVD